MTLMWKGGDHRRLHRCAFERLFVAGAINVFISGSVSTSACDSGKLHRVIESLATREEVERLKTIVEASKLINSSIEADTLFTSILAVATQELDVERGTVYSSKNSNNEIWSKVADGLAVREIRLPIGKVSPGTVAASGEAVGSSRCVTPILVSINARPSFRISHSFDVVRSDPQSLAAHRGRSAAAEQAAGSLASATNLDFSMLLRSHAIAMRTATLHPILLERIGWSRSADRPRDSEPLLPPPVRLWPNTPHSPREVCRADQVCGDYYDSSSFRRDLGSDRGSFGRACRRR